MRRTGVSMSGADDTHQAVSAPHSKQVSKQELTLHSRYSGKSRKAQSDINVKQRNAPPFDAAWFQHSVIAETLTFSLVN